MFTQEKNSEVYPIRTSRCVNQCSSSIFFAFTVIFYKNDKKSWNLFYTLPKRTVGQIWLHFLKSPWRSKQKPNIKMLPGSFLVLVDHCRRNWFRIFSLSMVAIGLQNPHAKTKADKSCTVVWCSLTRNDLLLMGSKYLEHIPLSEKAQ